jgi:hypothetical protein
MVQSVLRVLGGELDFAKLEYIWGYCWPSEHCYPLKLTNMTSQKKRDTSVVIVRAVVACMCALLLSFALVEQGLFGGINLFFVVSTIVLP